MTGSRVETQVQARAIHRPAWISGTLSLSAGALAVALVASGDDQLRVLAVAIVGCLVLALGVEFRHRGHDLEGFAIALGGTGVAVWALSLGYASGSTLSGRLELLPGLLGLILLSAGLAGLRSGWERHLVTAGTGLILVGVVTSGVVLDASMTALLVAGVATIVAWDVGEQAINLGEQVGRTAETHSVELVHAGGSLAVGAVGAGLAVGIHGGNVTGLPLAGLALLLCAAVILALSLYN